MRGLPLLCLCLLGCYRPEAVPACAISCNANAECPEGNVCGSDQRCSPAGGPACDPIEPPPPDGPPIDGACARPYGLGLLSVCLMSTPDALFQPGGDLTIDTSMDATCTFVLSQSQLGAPELCVKAAVSIDLDFSLRIIGSRPLVLLATNQLSLGTGASIQSYMPPGIHPAYCLQPASGTPQANRGAGGGAGGSFGGMGGSGGAGDDGMVAPPRPGENPTFVRGGCPGGRGGSGAGSPQGSLPGDGGSAVYLLAGNTIDISGYITVAGRGGQGASSSGGGGAGGGAGGMIILDAPEIVTQTGMFLLASGGGGGGGSANGQGAAGEDPFHLMPIGFGGGGQDRTDQGSGGNGSGSGLDGSSGGTAISGGSGGGGGGAGLIRFYSNNTPAGGLIFPPLS